MPATTNIPDVYTFSDLIVVLRRWRKLAVLTFFAVLVPALLVTFLMPPLYQATARVMISRQSNQPEYSIKSTRPEVSSVHRTLERGEEVNTYGEVIKSRTIVAAAVGKLGVDRKALDHIHDARRYVRAVYVGVKSALRWSYNETKYLLHVARRPTLEEQAYMEQTALIDDAVDRVRISPVPDSTVLEVGFRSSDPLLARDMVNAICNGFIARHSAVRRARTFFADETKMMAATLHELETELDTLRNQTNSYSSEEQRRFLIGFLAETKNKRKLTAAARAGIQARIFRLQEQFDDEPKRVLARIQTDRNPALDALNERLMELEIERAELAQDFLPEGIVLAKLDAELREARSIRKEMLGKLEGSRSDEINPISQGTRAELLRAQAELSSLIAQESAFLEMEASYREELAELGRSELRLKELERSTEAQEEAYLLYLRNQEQARITEGLASARLAEARIIDYSPLPLNTLRPRRLRYSGIALVAAILLALAMPFLAEYNDPTFSSERQVQRILEIPVVASFPPLGARSVGLALLRAGEEESQA